MEDSSLVRCDSLDGGSGCDKELMTHIDHMSFYPEDEPSPAELAQCEAEVGTLLSIIAEVNKKMGSLKAPSELEDFRPPGPPSPLFPDLLSHRLVRSSPEKILTSNVTFRPSLTDRGGSSSVMWTKLQEALTSVEDSISCRRSWAAPITSSDPDKHREHLRAAQESRTKAAQILEEIEKEFGISCPSSLSKDLHQGENLDLQTLDSPHRLPLQSHQGELERLQSPISPMEEEKNKLVSHQRSWRSGSCSPSHRPSGTAGALRPDWASASFPGSPLLLRRAARAAAAAAAPSSVGGDDSPLSSVHSGSPCPSPMSPETETERLHRCIERLKSRNERLTAALERRKAESEQSSIKLKRLEAECSALQTALRYSEECEEAYGELLSLYDAKRQHGVPQQPDSAEGAGGSSAQLRNMGAEELSTSFSTAGVSEEMEARGPAGQRTPVLAEREEREVALRQQIEHLRRDRAAICLPKPGPGEEGKMNRDAGAPAGWARAHLTKENTKPADSKKEKASLFYELISVRGEMSDLRALIRLKEKELRCLEWSLMAQKSQEAAGVFVPESVQEELEGRKSEQQRLRENAAKFCGDGDAAGLRSRPILKELQAVLQREQALKKRLALVHDSLNTALLDSATNRTDNEEQIARLTQAHSKALSSYRHIRRKYREQVWRLEQKVAAMIESHDSQSGAAAAAAVAAAATGEALEWRREETVL